jgi:hypothetical protein
LQTTIHTWCFALGRELAPLLDALLAASGPRLTAVRDALARLSAAILASEATTLPVDGAGRRRREPTDAVCAAVLADAAAFYAEVAEVAAALSDADAAAMLRDAVAWDALQVLPPDGETQTRRFAYDWREYSAHMGERPRPRATSIDLDVRSWPPSSPDPAVRLDVFLALGWSKQARFMVESSR